MGICRPRDLNVKTRTNEDIERDSRARAARNELGRHKNTNGKHDREQFDVATSEAELATHSA
jgi:hypothetical protein